MAKKQQWNWQVEGRDELGDPFVNRYRTEGAALERVAEMERNGGRARYYPIGNR